MSTPYRIVVGIDFHEGSSHAIEEAVRIAARISPAEIHAVTAAPSPWRASHREQAVEDTTSELHRFVHQHPAIQEHSPYLELHIRVGDPVQALVQIGVDLSADLIVVGPHEKGILDRRSAGSVTKRLLARSRCPVLVARPKDYLTVTANDSVAPPCPDCVAARAGSEGELMWCETHAEHANRAEPSNAIRGASRPPSRMY